MKSQLNNKTSLDMKYVFVLLNVALALSAPYEDNPNSKRFITVYDDEDGTPEVIDTLAPLPEPKVSLSDITLYLYTRTNPNNPVHLPLDINSLASASAFDVRRTNVFVIHGWTNTWQSEINSRIREAYMRTLDVNLFVVDWSRPGGGTYGSAFSNVPIVGRFIGNFLLDMQNRFGLRASNFLLVGFSLGAHVAGCAGAAAHSNIETIVGLDAAGPLFMNSITSNRLDPTDAQFVQAIHTNGGVLGYNDDLGDADIRPNGGSSQPGCGMDLTGSCAHGRSYEYYAESVASGGFTSWFCNNHNQFNNNQCSNNPRTHLGGRIKDTGARGRYFLNTNSASPFSLA